MTSTADLDWLARIPGKAGRRWLAAGEGKGGKGAAAEHCTLLSAERERGKTKEKNREGEKRGHRTTACS